MADLTRIGRGACHIGLRAFPRAFRERHGRALAQTFANAWRAERSPWRKVELATDLAAAGLRERRAGRLAAAHDRHQGGHMFNGAWAEIRRSARALRQRPALTLGVVLTLAIGIGATTAIFSVIYGVLLRPLPFPHPDRLVAVWETKSAAGLSRMVAAPPNLDDWRRESSSFEDLGAFITGSTILADDGAGEYVEAADVTANLFSLLGTRPELGRVFGPEHGHGAPTSVILSDAYWRRRFGGDPAIIGRQLSLERGTCEVIGVMPPGFDFPPPISFDPARRPQPADLYFPLAWDDMMDNRGAHYVTVIGRLKPGVTTEAANRDLGVIAARAAAAYPGTNAGWGVLVAPLRDEVVGDVRATLLLLFGAVALVLLLACANTAHLLLARALDRRREIAVRAALGAGRWRLVRQLLAEGLLLAGAGSLVGLAFAAWGLRALRHLAPSALPRVAEIGLDGSTLAATLAGAMLAALLSSLAPALYVLRGGTAAVTALRDRAEAVGSAGRGARRVLIAAEAAMAVAIVVLAVLFGRSFLQLRGVDPGFSPEHVLTMHVTLPAGYGTAEARSAYTERLLGRLRALPGVGAAGVIDAAPLQDDRQGTIAFVPGQPMSKPGEEPRVNYAFISPGYFKALGIPLLDGRTFTAADRGSGEPVTIVSESFARRFFPGERAVGRQVNLGFQLQISRRIVGVVKDERHESLAVDRVPGTYAPIYQFPRSRFAVYVRTAGAPADASAAVRAAAQEIDPTVALYDVQPMTAVVSASLAANRFSTNLIVLFAAAALLLAALGVYGVVSHGVASRRSEIGIRVALGASPRDVIGGVLRPHLALATLGTVFGLALAASGAVAVRHLLFGVNPLDARLYAFAAAVVLAVAGVATWLPARRAARVDPLVALRE